MELGLWIDMNMFKNLSDLQRSFICNCLIAFGIILWPVFGFISVANEWRLCCIIFTVPFFLLALFIIVMGIYIFIIRLRFKWQIMGVLTKEEYSSVIHKLWINEWDFDEMYNVETSSAVLEVLDKVKPFWNDKLE